MDKLKIIPKDTIMKMLERENELRLSDEYQRLYEKVEKGWDMDWLDVTHQLQIRVIKEFNIDDLDDGLYQLRTATQKYPEFSDIPLYVKYNRSRIGDLNVGDDAPNFQLYNLDYECEHLIDKTQRCQLIVGGSYS